MNSLINISRLDINEHDFSLNIKDLTFKKNEIVAIIGKSGSGKSTLLESILGLNSHKIELEKVIDIRLGYVPQTLALYNNKSVYENLIIPFKITKSFIDEELINYYLEVFDFEKYRHRLVSELSGGQQSKVAIIRSLLLDSQLIFLDEPLSSLDELSKHELVALFKKLRDCEKKTIVVVTHDLNEIIDAADRVVILSEQVEVVERKELDSCENKYEYLRSKL